MKTKITLALVLVLSSACASAPRAQGTRLCQYGESTMFSKPVDVWDNEAWRETNCKIGGLFWCSEQVVKIDPATKEISYKAPGEDDFAVIADLQGNNISFRQRTGAFAGISKAVTNVMGIKQGALIDTKNKQVLLKGTLLGKQTEEKVPYGESCSVDQVAVGVIFKSVTSK